MRGRRGGRWVEQRQVRNARVQSAAHNGFSRTVLALDINKNPIANPLGDSTVTVKCVLAVKLILPKNEMQTDVRMTFTHLWCNFAVIFAVCKKQI